MQSKENFRLWFARNKLLPTLAKMTRLQKTISTDTTTLQASKSLEIALKIISQFRIIVSTKGWGVEWVFLVGSIPRVKKISHADINF